MKMGQIRRSNQLIWPKLVRMAGLEPARPVDTSTSSWPVYQFQHIRIYICSKNKKYYNWQMEICQVPNLPFFQNAFQTPIKKSP